jgi:hypothetical protein
LGALNGLAIAFGVIGVCAFGGRNGLAGVSDLTAGGLANGLTDCAGTILPPVDFADSVFAFLLIIPLSPPARDSGDLDVLNWLPGFFTPGVLGAEYLSRRFDSAETLGMEAGSYKFDIGYSVADRTVLKEVRNVS